MAPDHMRALLTTVFQSTFDDPNMQLRDEMTAQDVEGWDSLTHINLIVAVEKAFKIKFTTREVQRLANVGQLLQLVNEKLAR